MKNIQLRTFDSVITPSFLLFLLLTGSRKSEAAGLLWADVSFKDTKVTFRDTKTAAERTIPIHEKLIAVLEDLKRINETGSSSGLPSKEAGKFVFPGPGKTGHLMVHQRVMNNFFKANPDIPSFSAHDLRRTFITIGKQVTPGDFVEVIVGHSIQTVFRSANRQQNFREMWGLFRNGSARTRRYRKQRKTVETEAAPKKNRGCFCFANFQERIWPKINNGQAKLYEESFLGLLVFGLFDNFHSKRGNRNIVHNENPMCRKRKFSPQGVFVWACTILPLYKVVQASPNLEKYSTNVKV